MFEKLAGVEDRYVKLEQLLSDPAVVRDQALYQKYVREHGDLGKVVDAYRQYKSVIGGIRDSRELIAEGDPEIRDLAEEELASLAERKSRLEQRIKVLMIPKDPNDAKNVMLEIRAGTGGDEAALFAGDLLRMYARFAETRSWKTEIMDAHESDVGGFKEVVMEIRGDGAYSIFKYESGTHRVQRVPATESQGRIHTSAVTVAVLPEAEEVDVHIEPADIKVDVFRASGPGGQSVNTTDSAVRVTHIPTGIVATCQDQKSQTKNKAKALAVLRARILDKAQREQAASRSQDRKSQIGSGDRSERIRTYNFPQGRVTDHRIGLTLYRLESVLQGDLDEVVQQLITHYQAQALKDADGGI